MPLHTLWWVKNRSTQSSGLTVSNMLPICSSLEGDVESTTNRCKIPMKNAPCWHLLPRPLHHWLSLHLLGWKSIVMIPDPASPFSNSYLCRSDPVRSQFSKPVCRPYAKHKAGTIRRGFSLLVAQFRTFLVLSIVRKPVTQ